MTFDAHDPSGEDLDRERLARSSLRRRKRRGVFAGLFLAGSCAAIALGAVWFIGRSPSTLAIAPRPQVSEPRAVSVETLPGDAAKGAPAKDGDVVGTTLPPSAPSGAADPPPASIANPAPPIVAALPTPAPQPAPSLATEETRQFIARARAFLAKGDVSTARLFFERAADHGDAQGAFALAETYDPLALARWKARGVAPDIGKARALYAQALGGGVAEASKRIAELVGK